ncbi:hypothetical protein Tco_1495650, partial [Tanacetum coccineum]
MNNEGTSRQSTLSLTSYRDSLPHLSPQNYLDPTKDEEHIPTMFHRQTTMMNRQVLMHMEQRGAHKPIRKAFCKVFTK